MNNPELKETMIVVMIVCVTGIAIGLFGLYSLITEGFSTTFDVACALSISSFLVAAYMIHIKANKSG